MSRLSKLCFSDYVRFCGCRTLHSQRLVAVRDTHTLDQAGCKRTRRSDGGSLAMRAAGKPARDLDAQKEVGSYSRGFDYLPMTMDRTMRGGQRERAKVRERWMEGATGLPRDHKRDHIRAEA